MCVRTYMYHFELVSLKIWHLSNGIMEMAPIFEQIKLKRKDRVSKRERERERKRRIAANDLFQHPEKNNKANKTNDDDDDDNNGAKWIIFIWRMYLDARHFNRSLLYHSNHALVAIVALLLHMVVVVFFFFFGGSYSLSNLYVRGLLYA